MKRLFSFNILIALAVLLFQIFIIYLFGWNIFNYTPYYSDELHYYNAAKNFYDSGWDSGYSILNEAPSILNLQFGPHGPVFPILIAISATLFGWYTFSPILYNSLALFLSSWVFISALESNTKKYKAVAVISTYIATVVFFPTTMQEITHTSIAILFCTIYFLKNKQNSNVRLNPTLLLFTSTLSILAVTLRSSWLPFIFLFFLFFFKINSIKYLIFLLFLLVLSVVWPYLTSSYYPSTTNFSMLMRWLTLQSDFDTSFFATQLKTNWRFLKDLNTFNISSSFRYLYYLISTIVLFNVITSGLNTASRKIYLFSLLILILQFCLVFFLYHFFGYRDFRTLAPFLLFSCLVVSIRSNFLFAIIFISQLSVLAASYDEIKGFRNFNFIALDHAEKTDLINLRNMSLFSENENKYCNTISYINPSGEPNLNRVVFLLGEGLGASVIVRDKYTKPSPKSRYILLEERQHRKLDIIQDFPSKSYRQIYRFSYSNDYIFGLYEANQSDC